MHTDDKNKGRRDEEDVDFHFWQSLLLDENQLRCGQAERECWLASELHDLGTFATSVSCKSLDQEPESFISKGPDGKYFGVCGPCGLCCNYLALPLWHKDSHR